MGEVGHFRLARADVLSCPVLAKVEVTQGSWKLQGEHRTQEEGEVEKEQAESVYRGLALSRSFSWQMLLAAGWGRAAQTANERFLFPGVATSLPRETGTWWPQADLSPRGFLL